MSNHEHSNPNTGPGYETSDVYVAPIAKFILGLVCLMVIGMFLAWTAFRLLHFRFELNYADMNTTKLQETRQVPAGPLLQVSNHDDLLNFRAKEAEEVSGHATWLDKNAKVVRLPIDRAMELVVERGLPVFKNETAPAATVEKKK